MPKLIFANIKDGLVLKLIKLPEINNHKLVLRDMVFPMISETPDQCLINGYILFTARMNAKDYFYDDISNIEYAMSKYVLDQEKIAEMFTRGEDGIIRPTISHGRLSPFIGILLAYYNADNDILRENAEVILYNKAIEMVKPSLKTSPTEALFLYTAYKLLSKSGTSSGIKLFKEYKQIGGALSLLKLALTQEEFFLVDLLANIEQNKYMRIYLRFVLNINHNRYQS